MHPYPVEFKKPKFTIAPISVQHFKTKINHGINLTPKKKSQENSRIIQALKVESIKDWNEGNFKKFNLARSVKSNQKQQQNQQNFNSQNQQLQHIYEPIHVSLLEPSLPSKKQKTFQLIKSFHGSQLQIRIVRGNYQQTSAILLNSPAINVSCFKPFQEKQHTSNGFLNQYRMGSIHYDGNVQFSGYNNNSSEEKGNQSPKKKRQKLSVISTSGTKNQQSDIRIQSNTDKKIDLSNSYANRNKFISNIDINEEIQQENPFIQINAS